MTSPELATQDTKITIIYHEYLPHIGFGKVSSVCRSVSCLSRFALRMRAILLLCQSVGHISEVLK